MRTFRTIMTHSRENSMGANAIHLENSLSLVFFGVLVHLNGIVDQTYPRLYACSR